MSDMTSEEAADTPTPDRPAWAAGLSDENRRLVADNNWVDKTSDGEGVVEINRALDAYRDLQSVASNAIAVPGEEASAEERDAFERRLGRPEDPEGYRFDLPDGLADDFPYSEEMAGRFRDWAFRAGLPAGAAQSLHDDYVRELADLHAAETERLTQAEERSHRESDAYRRNVLLADRAVTELGLGDVLREYGLMAPDGGVRDARIAMALARVGTELFAEDSVLAGQTGASNPFSGDNPNLTEQSRLIREARQDPSRAAHVRALMEAAGLDPHAQL